MADEFIRLDTTIIDIDSLISKASTVEEAKVLFTVKDVIYSQQRYFTDVQPVIHTHWRRGEENCGGQRMTFDEIKKQLRELLDDRRSFLTGDKDHDEIYLKDIKALELVLNGLDYHKSLKRSFENLVQQFADEQQATVTESCPHCDTEVTVKWLPSEDGHSIFCPKCGKRIMLCSECPARDGDMECDWLEKEPPCCSWDNIEGKENG